ncbi:MAG TPA: hypothetical protein VFI59_14915 [Actinomycetota bacterium]|nr:hypothetical protein [Actinomycetota bacterium]
MVAMRPDDHVAFVGPSGAVLKSPAPGERGVIQRVDPEAVHVVWECSPLLIAWPHEWIERREPQER